MPCCPSERLADSSLNAVEGQRFGAGAGLGILQNRRRRREEWFLVGRERSATRFCRIHQRNRFFRRRDAALGNDGNRWLDFLKLRRFGRGFGWHRNVHLRLTRLRHHSVRRDTHLARFRPRSPAGRIVAVAFCVNNLPATGCGSRRNGPLGGRTTSIGQHQHCDARNCESVIGFGLRHVQLLTPP